MNWLSSIWMNLMKCRRAEKLSSLQWVDEKVLLASSLCSQYNDSVVEDKKGEFEEQLGGRSTDEEEDEEEELEMEYDEEED